MSIMTSGRRDATNSDAHIPLPDPYGEGFEYSEDPLENTREQWAILERRRLLARRIARNPLLMIRRTLNGFLLAMFAFVSVLDSAVIELASGLMVLLIRCALISAGPSVIA